MCLLHQLKIVRCQKLAVNSLSGDIVHFRLYYLSKVIVVAIGY